MNEEPPKPRQLYLLVWDRWGRRGQRCEILSSLAVHSDNLQKVRFEDGFEGAIDRKALRQIKDSGKGENGN